jgi:5'-3' exonuclease
VNAIRGLLDAIGRLVRDRRPTRLIACLDADWRPAFRVAAIGSYKAHRAEPDGSEQTPPALAVQIPLITQVLEAAGVTLAEHAGYGRTTSSPPWPSTPPAPGRGSPSRS